MEETAKKILLEIARKSVESAVKKESLPTFSYDHPDILSNQGVFVTLKTRGQLRGCIGRFVSDIPLYKLVSEIAISSATEDSRFFDNPITPAELDMLSIELSILSPLKRITDPLDFELGKHGIYIKKGFQSGCFLPQVAKETGWNKEEFLSHCCSGKAGLPANAWKQDDIEIYTFTVEIIKMETDT
ncbi:MAG: AmmeMemoRadiSam system protein A [Candidatus Kuenenia sp.]|nr:AmmeMemoRadiSam system protein A [Candidatus Kuenenia hertensis]